MTHTIPAPVLTAVLNLAGMGEENALILAATALSRSTITQFAGPDDALEFLSLLQQHIAGTNPMVALSAMVGKIRPKPANASPHAPQRRTGAKPPYWAKVVKYFHPTTMNGYGLVGKFIAMDKAHLEPNGSVIVVQFKDFKSSQKEMKVLVRDDAFAGHNTLTSSLVPTASFDFAHCLDGGTFTNYRDLYDALARHGVPTGPVAATP